MKKIRKCKLNGNDSFREIDSCQSNLTQKLPGNYYYLTSCQSYISSGISWGSLISPVLFNILLMTWMKTERQIYLLTENMHVF